jgi:queuine/archaeosine tRNA-ribosyltransferase
MNRAVFWAQTRSHCRVCVQRLSFKHVSRIEAIHTAQALTIHALPFHLKSRQMQKEKTNKTQET